MTCDDVFDILTRGPFPSGAADDDDQVERHLARCAECRRLATALRPAVELFQESIEPDETSALPGYRGRVALPGAEDLLETCEERSNDESQGLFAAGWRPAWIRADAAARRFGARPAPSSALRNVRGEPPASFGHSATTARTNLFRFAAAVMLGVAAAAGARSWMQDQATSAGIPPSGPTELVATHDGHGEPGKHDLRWLAGLALPATCLPSEARAALRDSAQYRRFEGIQLASADHAVRLTCCTDCHNATRAGLLPGAGATVLMQACVACHD
ncbi:MAG TPA: hypothetical protein VHD36_10900 [Pirellulales bacterium]|nr:hypothetical protein [Pirellulales bacterium]